MNFNFSATVNLTLGQLKEIVSEAVKKELPGHEVTAVTFKIQDTTDERYYGGGNASYTVTGADVTLRPVPKT